MKVSIRKFFSRRNQAGNKMTANAFTVIKWHEVLSQKVMFRNSNALDLEKGARNRSESSSAQHANFRSASLIC